MTPLTGPASPPAGVAAGLGVRTGRGAELLLLVFAAVITTSALVSVEINQKQQLSTDLLGYGGAYLGLFTVAHLAVRTLAPFADPLILPCVALLNGLGLVMIYRLDLAAPAKAVQTGSRFPGATPRTKWCGPRSASCCSSGCCGCSATTAASPAMATPAASPGWCC